MTLQFLILNKFSKLGEGNYVRDGKEYGIGQGCSYLKKRNTIRTIFRMVFPSRQNEAAKIWFCPPPKTL
jgi:hypothetical protein